MKRFRQIRDPMWTFLFLVAALFACGRARQEDSASAGTAHEPTTRIIAGRVLQNDGNPFAERLKLATLATKGAPQNLEAYTDADGRFRLGGIPVSFAGTVIIQVWSGDHDLYIRELAYRDSQFKRAAIIVTLSSGQSQPVDVGTWLAEDLVTRRKHINGSFGPYCNEAFRGKPVLVPESVLVPGAARTLLLQWDSDSWIDSYELRQPARDDVAAVCLRETTKEVGSYGQRGDVLGLGGPAEDYRWSVAVILRGGRVFQTSFYLPAPKRAKGRDLGGVILADTGQVERLNELVDKWLEADRRRVGRIDPK